MLSTWKFMAFLLLILFSCQKEDPLKDDDSHHSHTEKQQVRKITERDIPDVMNFLKSKNSGSYSYGIHISSMEGMQNRSSEPDLILTDLETENILTLTDENGKTNYSFQLRLENAPQFEGEVSIFNLIVKETNTDTGFYAYIQEYRMDDPWFASVGYTMDMATYTGKMIFYTLEGVYVAKVDFDRGNILAEHTRSPCPGDGDPGSGDPGGSGGGGDGGPIGGGSSGGGSGGGTGGFNVFAGWLCNWRNELHAGPSDCNNAGMGGSWVVVIDGLPLHIRQGCEAPEPCFMPNQEPCCTTEGCEDENDGVIINLYLELPNCKQLMKISDHISTRNKIINLKSNYYLNSNNEHGFEIRNTEFNGVTVSANIRAGKRGVFNFIKTPNTLGVVHSHPNNMFPMFSIGDVLSLNTFYNTYFPFNNPRSVAAPVLIMVSNQGVFALKIENLTQFQSYFNSVNPENIDEEIFRKYKRLRHLNQETLSNFQKVFLQEIEGAGVSLYQANADVTGWRKIVLNEQGQPHPIEPCNY